MMKPSRILSRWIYSTLSDIAADNAVLLIDNEQIAHTALELAPGLYAVAKKQIFPLVTKEDVKGAYVIYDSLETSYTTTKDGCEPSLITARVLCVDKTLNQAEELADTVETLLNNEFITELASYVEITLRKSDYDNTTGEFLEEIRIRINL